MREQVLPFSNKSTVEGQNGIPALPPIHALRFEGAPGVDLLQDLWAACDFTAAMLRCYTFLFAGHYKATAPTTLLHQRFSPSVANISRERASGESKPPACRSELSMPLEMGAMILNRIIHRRTLWSRREFPPAPGPRTPLQPPGGATCGRREKAEGPDRPPEYP